MLTSKVVTRLRIAPAEVLGILGVWSVMLFMPLLPFPRLLMLPAFLVYIWACLKLYANDETSLEFTCGQLLFLLVAAVVAFFLHWPMVTYSILGDELAHARSSAFIIDRVQTWMSLLPPLPLEEVQRAEWLALDPRQTAVLDAWRVIALPLLALFALIAAAFRRYRKSLWFYAALAVLAMFFKWCFKAPTEFHPPLRLLPLFLAQLVGGLNPVSLRSAALVSTVFGLFLVWVVLTRGPGREKRWIYAAFVASIAFIPQLFYVSESLQPNLYAFIAWMLVFATSREVVFSGPRDAEKRLTWMGVVVAVGTLFRQTTVVLWLWIAFLAVCNRRNLSLRGWTKAFMPGLLTVPYFVGVKMLGGHPAIGDSNEGGPLQRLLSVFASGMALVGPLKSTTLPWVIVTIAALALGVIGVKRKRQYAFLLMFFPVFYLYNGVTYIHGIGRYQLEYISPFIAAAILNLAELRWVAARRMALATLFYLSLVSIEMDHNLSLDVTHYGSMRIFDFQHAPLTPALADLKRREAQGDFVIASTSPLYGPMSLWLGGASFEETRRWSHHQELYEKLVVAQGESLSEEILCEFFQREGIRFAAVTEGTRSFRNLGKQLWLFQGSKKFVLSGRFGPEHGGYVELYDVSKCR